MERHRCKLCSRNFSNGKALCGHMRSHMVNLPAAAKDEENIRENHDFEPGFSPPPHSSPSSSGEERSEAEPSVENRVHRRSKRARKSRVFYSRTGFDTNDREAEAEAEQTSSVSSAAVEEDVAHCLVMLSRDKWEENGDTNTSKLQRWCVQFKMARQLSTKQPAFGSVLGHKRYSSINEKNKKLERSKCAKFRGKYRCETCGKVFRTYQALGGHRASHGRIKAAAIGRSDGDAAAEVAAERIHECPFCRRVFASGQALGGHKRSHFAGGSAISANFCPSKQFSRIGGGLDIDLNLPPQDYQDDDYDDEISQVAISAVSDDEFFQ